MKSMISRKINPSINSKTSPMGALHIPSAIKLLAFFTVLVLMVSCAQKPAKMITDDTQKVTVTNISIDKNNDAYEMNISTDSEALFNTYYSKTPYKIIVMVEKSEFSSDLMEYNYSNGLVESVNLIPSTNFATIELKLTEDVSYSFDQSDRKLTVNFKPAQKEKIIGKSGMETGGIKVSQHKVAKYVETYNNLSDGSDLLVNIGVDGIVRYDYGYLDDGSFYLDLFDVKNDLKRKAYPGEGLVESVKVGSYYPPQKVRFIFEIAKSMPMFVGQDGSKLVVSNNISNVPQESKYIVSMDNIYVNNYQSIVVKLTNNVPFTKKIIDGNLVLTFDAPLKVLNSIKNVLSFDKQPFKKVRITEINGNTSIIVEPNGEIYAKVDQMPEGILVTGSYNEFSKSDMNLKEQVQTSEDKTMKKEMQKPKKEDLISININQMDVREAIRLVYYGRAENLVFGKNVKGAVTLYLDKVDYRNALQMIYKENSLMEVKEDNITWVITKERYQGMQQAKIQAKQQEKEQKQFEPLQTEIVPVNYASASVYKGIITSVLSDRGKLQIEERTNSFIINDSQTYIDNAKNLLSKLDNPTPQVRIEGRVVEVQDTNNLNLGIQWGANYSQSATTANFPNTINVEGTPGNNGYMVNLPASSTAGALALTFGNVAGTFNLDMALSALESKERIKTISSPSVTTLDNQEAEIKSGRSYTYTVGGANGGTATTETCDATLSLNITPNISPNNSVNMNIEIKKNSLLSITSNSCEVAENTATTNLLVSDGETAVIGGIYENTTREMNTSVPFFSKIPIIGWLFKNKENYKTKNELLVFITPKVIR